MARRTTPDRARLESLQQNESIQQESGVFTRSGNYIRTRMQSFHEQSLSVANAMAHSRPEKDDDEEVEGKGSLVGAICILMNAIMGASILVLPYSFARVGIVTSVIMEVFVVCIGGITHIILAAAVDKYNGSNYQDLVGRICGPYFRLGTQFLLFIYFFTLSCATHITIGDQSVKICMLADGNTDIEHWFCNRHFLIPVCSMTLIFPLIWFKNISSFSYTSAFSVLACFYIVISVVIDYFRLGPVPHVNPAELWYPDVGILELLAIFPIYTLGFQCHMTSVPLYYELDNRSIGRYAIAIALTKLLVLTIYLGTGIFGVLTLGPDMDPDMLLTYAHDDILMTIARACISIAIISSYPIFQFLGRGAVEDSMRQVSENFNHEMSAESETRRIVMNLVWHFGALGISMLTSSLAVVMKFTGSIAALFMLFFPGYMLWKEAREHKNWGFGVAAMIIMVLGGFTFFWTIGYNAYQLGIGAS